MSTGRTVEPEKGTLGWKCLQQEAEKDAGGADPETGAVPFPQQKAKGRSSSAECGRHHEVLRTNALVP